MDGVFIYFLNNDRYIFQNSCWAISKNEISLTLDKYATVFL